MKKFKEIGTSVLACIMELIIGTLLLINPVSFTSGILVTVGIILILLGLVDVIKYFRTDVEEAARRQLLVKGLVCVLGGEFCAVKTEWFIATFPVLTMIYGVFILVTGIGKVQLTVDMLRRKNKKWFWAAINAVISIACAVVVLNAPFASTVVLWSFTGISLIVEGVLDIVTLVFSGKAEETE